MCSNQHQPPCILSNKNYSWCKQPYLRRKLETFDESKHNKCQAFIETAMLMFVWLLSLKRRFTVLFCVFAALSDSLMQIVIFTLSWPFSSQRDQPDWKTGFRFRFFTPENFQTAQSPNFDYCWRFLLAAVHKTASRPHFHGKNNDPKIARWKCLMHIAYLKRDMKYL